MPRQKSVHVVLVDDGAQLLVFVVRFAKQPVVQFDLVNPLLRPCFRKLITVRRQNVFEEHSRRQLDELRRQDRRCILRARQIFWVALYSHALQGEHQVHRVGSDLAYDG